MKNIVVYKVGGSILAEPDDFVKIGRRIIQHRKKGVCIVTSAMKGKTSELVEMYQKAIPQPDFWGFERFAGFGEIQSAWLFESVFTYLNIRARAVLPWMKEWPLFVSLQNTQQLSAEKINEKRKFKVLSKSANRVSKYLAKLWHENQVVIIPGFVAKDSKERIVTLGRGGSDISAFLIAELLHAKELVLLKESDGILNADPRLHKKARKVSSLVSDELGVLAASGAQVLHPLSLKHQDRIRKVKIVSVNSSLDENKGTEVTLKKGITIFASPVTFTVLTFIGTGIPETPGLLSKISSILARQHISIYSITISDNLIAIYLDHTQGDAAYLHLSPLLTRSVHLKALNIKQGIGKIVVRGFKFINEPGIIKRLVTPISQQGINIWEVLTVHTDVMIFVEAQDLNKTLRLVRSLYKKRE